MREKHGATFFEGKLTLGDPALEIATVKAIRSAVGDDAMMRLDANMAWSLSTARHILREIEPYNIRNYEDPVATFEEMAQAPPAQRDSVLDTRARSETRCARWACPIRSW